MRCKDRASGFTLIEVLVALFVGAMVILMARAILETAEDASRRITDDAQRVDEDANAERYLRAMVGGIDAGGATGESFDGEAASAEFASWCLNGNGWATRCRATLSLQADQGGFDLVTRTPGGSMIVLRRDIRHGSLRYLQSAAHSGEWVSEWGPGVSVPSAIGVFANGDTLILATGEAR